MSHQCKALVIHCMDFRFHSAIRDFLVSLGIKDQYDLVSLAGATKGLVENDPDSTAIILKQIEIFQFSGQKSFSQNRGKGRRKFD